MIESDLQQALPEIDENRETFADVQPLCVAAFTGGVAVAGARFRLRQFIGPMRKLGIEILENYSSVSSYPPPIYSAWKHLVRPAWAAVSLGERIPAMLRSRKADLTFLQREILSAHMTLEWLVGSPRIYDVDDAAWLSGDPTAAGRIARICEMVICGNTFLADYFSRWNPRVEVLPTAVDTERFHPSAAPGLGDTMIIGWSGAGDGNRQLETVEPALAKVLAKHPGARLRVMSQVPAKLRSIPPEKVEFVRWSEDGEVAAFQGMDVGVMPLPDDDRCRGKCSYKMLLYMACGVPVVVSPVGMNREVLGLGRVGYGAETLSQWSEALDALLSDGEAAKRMGHTGREVVLQHFSVAVITPKLAALMRQVARNGPKG